MEDKKKNKIADFIERFGIYIFAGVLILVIGVSLGIIYLKEPDQEIVDVSNNDKEEPLKDEEKDTQEDEKKDEEVNAEAVTFALPMNNLSVIKDYTDTKLEYNPTLDRWESHYYIDMTSSDLSVYSVLDGVVDSVDYSYLTGYVVSIKHDDGFVSSYGSLGENVLVKVGDKILKGEKIGEASALASKASKYGEHLEFTLLQNNKKVDPNNYLNLQNK